MTIFGQCYNVLSNARYLMIIYGQGSFATQHFIQHQFAVFSSAESSSLAVSNICKMFTCRLIPKLSNARDNNDQLCKDVDLLASHIRDKRTPWNQSLQINSISMESRVTNSTDPISS